MRNFFSLQQLQPGDSRINTAPVQNALEAYGNKTMQFGQIQRQNEEQTYQRGRESKQDARQDETWKMQNLERLGKSAFAYSQLAPEQRDPQTWGKIVKGMQSFDPSIGTDPDDLDPIVGPAKFAAVYGGQVRDPREDKLMDLKLQGAQLDIANAQRGKTPDLQEVYTDTGGKQKGYFQNGQFVPVGGVAAARSEQLTASDRKAILEADDKTQANASAISTLDQALELNKNANAGWGAGIRSSVGNNLPDLLVPDVISSPQSAQAAAELDNAIIGNALEQLKATFGGMPTEGERKILIDIQGSINQPREVRKAIYERAKALAEQRLKVNREEAEKLRGGTYYKPGGAAALPQPPPQTQQQLPQAGPQPGAVEDGYRFKGGNPSDPNAWEKVQ